MEEKTEIRNIKKHIEEIKIKYAENGFQVQVQIDIRPTFVYFICSNVEELNELLVKLTTK